MIRELGRPGDLGWVVMAHGELYARECGWDTSFEALVARIMADFAGGRDPVRERGWIAETDGRRVGCVLCVDGGDDTAVLRVLLVDPAARGHGFGGQLVDTCLDFARKNGYVRMKLWTTDLQKAATALYISRGFELIKEEPHEGFGAGELNGRTYAREL
ncbi:GNAT family N-acetyltransferase [Paractinoplanes brasiliensis]|uniref:Acetyltransferase (GNAT) family protein n=1 Tax=Paractinoplanes brasiliensis TaxID=52695 RepID=A0A4R6J8J3_9ACTN|nr:GNAT family N-acetyltransferase [Actinoplanes brasiliensis]TDO31923.1 acetyltransferase (GNAT) family protein [Actinoplanes brasiliensis]GID27966.1 MarR family transcriptional regulator [Actinoplanes brasiliensis]